MIGAVWGAHWLHVSGHSRASSASTWGRSSGKEHALGGRQSTGRHFRHSQSVGEQFGGRADERQSAGALLAARANSTGGHECQGEATVWPVAGCTQPLGAGNCTTANTGQTLAQSGRSAQSSPLALWLSARRRQQWPAGTPPPRAPLVCRLSQRSGRGRRSELGRLWAPQALDGGSVVWQCERLAWQQSRR